MLTPEQIADSAETAADLIENQGWFRVGDDGRAVIYKTYEEVRKCYCALTALPNYGCEIVSCEFAKFLGWSVDTGMSHSDFVISWNDSQASAEIVISTLRNFAVDIRRKDSLTNA